MSVTRLQEPGKTRITEKQYEELYKNGFAPFDMQCEDGRLGIVFNVAGRGIVRLWHIEGAGHFLESPQTLEEARWILTPQIS